MTSDVTSIQCSASCTVNGSAPVVSVVMPAFNCAQFVRRAIDSVLAQSMVSFELIIVDDASTDAGCDIIASYRDPRIRLIRNARNMGPSRSRNKGMAQARGDWIALLDADDWYAEERLEKLLALAEQHQVDAVADDLYIVDHGRGHARSTLFLESGFPISGASLLDPAQLTAHEIGAMKPMFRRALYSERGHAYDATVCYGEDYLLYLSWLLDGVRLLVLPEPLYYLRRGATGSLTTRRIAMAADAVALNQRLLGDARLRRNLPLQQALAARIVKASDMLVFYRVVSPLREKRYASAASALLASPAFVAVACKRLPAILSLRARRIAYRWRQSLRRPPATLACDRS